jgi:hypothetical protein
LLIVTIQAECSLIFDAIDFTIAGLTVKICYFDGSGRPTVESEEKTLYCEEDFHELLVRRGWQSLREVGGYKDIDTMEELQPMCAYQQGGFKDLGLYIPKVE